jgi:hypothetical protein
VDANPVGRVDAEGGPMEVLRRGGQATGDDPVVEDLAGPVEVGEQHLQRFHPLGHARRQGHPLALGDDPGHQVEREGPFLAEQLEGDAPVPKAPVAGRAPGFELVGGE